MPALCLLRQPYPHVSVWLTALLCAGSALAEPLRAQADPPAGEARSQAAPAETPSDITENAIGNQPANEPEDTAAVPMPFPGSPPPPPPAAISPFEFTLKGTVAVTLFAQDSPVLSGNGGAALLGPAPVLRDGWLLGGDVRQTRLAFNVRGPEIIGATPTAVVEVEMYGGNQLASSAQGDESLLPRLRTAYIEFNWDAGTNLVRAGQYHNLLLAMVSASGAHPATLGYGAGQLGWREPGITYSHKFTFGEDVHLDAAVQLNRNSWNDNAATCVAPMAPPATNCLPSGVSLGEAGLPQIEARLLLSGGLAPSPFPLYAPTVWQLYVVGHWDRKDLSGVNNVAPPGVRDSMTTYAVEAGGKLRLGPVLVASNGWYGQNTGSLFGNAFQIQGPDKPDVSGFGAWGQAAFSFSERFSIWAFAGIDRPNQAQALAAGFQVLQNVQIAGMLAYTNGPLVLAAEWMNIATTGVIQPMAATATTPATGPGQLITRGNQPSITAAYTF
jgi:hypothetical protein